MPTVRTASEIRIDIDPDADIVRGSGERNFDHRLTDAYSEALVLRSSEDA
jgi:hypothetical protein